MTTTNITIVLRVHAYSMLPTSTVGALVPSTAGAVPLLDHTQQHAAAEEAGRDRRGDDTGYLVRQPGFVRKTYLV